jgi:hypothetical protein
MNMLERDFEVGWALKIYEALRGVEAYTERQNRHEINIYEINGHEFNIREYRHESIDINNTTASP